ncbi:single-stranded DNA-binding protein [Holdemanella sp.]|uniref:single-stranded DNA-binding protein n=1 Tax=Holdemanella sp. TaxID=1971762 RepID=UPI002582C0DA|nr:single-stranded DNA-binding protein [Holdemanella sp.]
MLNEVNLVGRISNVPRISRTKANVSVITCNVANQRSENYVDFIQCVFFDQEYLEKRLKKRYEDFS